MSEAAVAATGYVLVRKSWGEGFATEALGAMVSLARDMTIARVFALCHPNHQASIKVLVKCGFEQEEQKQEIIEFPNLRPEVKAEALRYGLSTN